MSSRLSHTHSHYDSEDSDGAPEAITLSNSKKASRAKEQAFQEFESEQKAKRKRENREKNRALKEAKEERKKIDEEQKARKAAKTSVLDEREGKANDGATGGPNTMGRTERVALQDDDDDDKEDSTDEGMRDGKPGLEDESEEAEEWGGFDSKPANYLPNHLFSIAAYSAPQTTEKTTSKRITTKTPLKRPKSVKTKAKDLIVGSRRVRTIEPNSLTTTSLTLPPARINKFLKRSLKLRNSEASVDKGPRGSSTKRTTGNKGVGNGSQSWERRAANIGVFRNTKGPAFMFARGS